MSTKQDRHGARTAADLERKYKLSNTNKGQIAAASIMADTLNAVERMAAELRVEFTESLELAIQDAEQRIENALKDYIKTSDLDAYKATVKAELDRIKEAFNGELAALKIQVQDNAGSLEAMTTKVDANTQNVQQVSTDLEGVVNDLTTHFSFESGGTKILGRIVPHVIAAGTDLDDLLTPNKYVSGNVAENNYVNCPISTGTFSLDVESCGDEEQLKQSLTYSSKTASKTFERYNYGTGWGEWVCVTDFNAGKLLWSGENYMHGTQTVTLPEAVRKQMTGIVLVFCEYMNGAASSSAFHCFFVPKVQVATQDGKGYTFTLATGKFEYMATKYLYIYDTKIEGHADNNQTGTGTSGVKFTNNRFVLRYVFGI